MESNYPYYQLINKVNVKYVAILSIAALSLLIRLILFPEFSFQVQLFMFSVSLASITVIWTTLEFIDRLLNRYLPYEQGVFRRIIIQIGIGLSFLYISISLLLFFLLDIFPVHIDKISKLFAYLIATLIILTINGGSAGAYFFKEWKKAIIKNERLQKERSMVQFDNLKNQLNPHFLFNSLTSLNSLIFENQQLASQFLQQLSKVYRYVLQNKEKELVSLETEIKFIENYIFLLQTRFCNSLHIEIAVNPESAVKQIVPVTLQILIENAIKHNVINEQNPLTIKIYTANNYLMVENNLQKKNIIENSNKIGLENMKTLYAYLSPLPIVIAEHTHLFVVKIPLID